MTKKRAAVKANMPEVMLPVEESDADLVAKVKTYAEAVASLMTVLRGRKIDVKFRLGQKDPQNPNLVVLEEFQAFKSLT